MSGAAGYRAVCSVALCAGVAVAAPAAAEDLFYWNETRASLFSDVCMASAPNFGNLAALAEDVGFALVNGELHYPPEVVVSLVGDGTYCACYMTMGAPDPGGMILSVVDRVTTDYPETTPPIDGGNPADFGTFDRGGTEVRLVLNPHEYDGLTFLAGLVVAPGSCPS